MHYYLLLRHLLSLADDSVIDIIHRQPRDHICDPPFISQKLFWMTYYSKLQAVRKTIWVQLTMNQSCCVFYVAVVLADLRTSIHKIYFCLYSSGLLHKPGSIIC